MDCTTNREAELAMIGLALQDATCALQAAALPEAYFSARDTQALHRAIQRLTSSGRTADLLTVSAEAKTDLEEPEGLLIQCIQAGFAPSMYGQYAGLLADCHKRRLMHSHGSALIAAAIDPSASPEAATDAAMEALRGENGQGSSVTAQQGLMALMDSIDEAKKGRVYTGIADLDRLTGGFRGGKLVVLGARPGVGKTALALQIARYAATHCAPVLVVSLEMDEAEIMSRVVSAMSGVDVQLMESGALQPEHWGRLTEVMSEAARLPLHISTHATTPAQIRREASALKYKGGLGLIVVDYLQLLHSSGKTASRYEEVSAISRELKQLAMDLQVPVLALTQFNRQSEMGVGGKAEKRKPSMAESKDSGSIEQDANMFLTLWEPPEPSSDQEQAFMTWRACYNMRTSWMALHIDKNRQGRTGCMFLSFDKPHMTFQSIDTREP